VAKAEDEQQEKPHPQEPARRSGSYGDLCRCGLGLDQALIRIGQELGTSHPDIAEEFTQVNLEQRAGRPRLEAWKNLADRSEIEELLPL